MGTKDLCSPLTLFWPPFLDGWLSFSSKSNFHLLQFCDTSFCYSELWPRGPNDQFISVWLQESSLPRPMGPKPHSQFPVWGTGSGGVQGWRREMTSPGLSLWPHPQMLSLATTHSCCRSQAGNNAWASSHCSLTPGIEVSWSGSAWAAQDSRSWSWGPRGQLRLEQHRYLATVETGLWMNGLSDPGSWCGVIWWKKPWASHWEQRPVWSWLKLLSHRSWDSLRWPWKHCPLW